MPPQVVVGKGMGGGQNMHNLINHKTSYLLFLLDGS